LIGDRVHDPLRNESCGRFGRTPSGRGATGDLRDPDKREGMPIGRRAQRRLSECAVASIAT
jgi:hypothetical protein